MIKSVISKLLVGVLLVLSVNGCENIEPVTPVEPVEPVISSSNPLVGHWQKIRHCNQDDVYITFCANGYWEQETIDSNGMIWWTEGVWLTENENLFMSRDSCNVYDVITIFHINNNVLTIIENAKEGDVVTTYRKIKCSRTPLW